MTTIWVKLLALGVVEDAVGDVRGRNGDGLAAQALGQAQALGDAVALGFAELLRARGLDMDRRPGRAQPVGQPPGIAHERRRSPGVR